ncbi:threonine-phosphate decarboxylase [Desulfurella multipotens]|uniref:Threonine-phosphate decarboxylase n=1 Tax=Desulfurella multipotens TaxID=79269 RepID=A0A1G6Q1Z3_9BACT|nr:aminotransferase class I/II-fold pyridoxal phosphate-dependent enzyme [Desulfurella multipotens]SDC86383.1 threonine-phosphate decarboxylase [Desulfurella multipotens]
MFKKFTMDSFFHGADIYSFAKKLNIKPKDVIDFSSNINFVKPKVKLKNINVSPYPDPRYVKLKKAISKKYNIDKNYIQLFNGSTDAIFTIINHFDDVTLYAPIFSEYKKANKVQLINRFSNMYEIPPKDSLVVFVNPSTPDGTYYDLKKFFDIWCKQNNTVLIDESFLDFSGKKSALCFLKDFEKLIILKSFSKFYGCAGVRVGVLISKTKFKAPLWNISTFDEQFILQALKDKKFEIKSKIYVEKNKQLLREILENSDLFEKIYDSSTNFLLAKLKHISSIALQDKLSAYNILIRDCSNFDFLDEFHVRFAVKTKKELKILKKALK